MNDVTPVLRCEGLSKVYQDANVNLRVLDAVDFSINPNETVAILGASGSGKSTLLHLLGGLDRPSSGSVFWNAQDLARFSEKQKCRYRNQHLGFIYQFHHLLPEFTAIENIAMPLLLGGASARQARQEAVAFLEKIGLSERGQHKSGELSGGERQRVAIARALITRPACVLADEPTGNLDQHTAEQILTLMFDLQKTLSTSFVIVTHNTQLVHLVDKSYRLAEGQLSLVE